MSMTLTGLLFANQQMYDMTLTVRDHLLFNRRRRHRRHHHSSSMYRRHCHYPCNDSCYGKFILFFKLSFLYFEV